MKFLSEIFQDIDGGFSMKRSAFALFILLFIVVGMAVIFKAFDSGVLDFLKDLEGKIVDVIKWMGGFIVAERIPNVTQKSGGG